MTKLDLDAKLIRRCESLKVNPARVDIVGLLVSGYADYYSAVTAFMRLPFPAPFSLEKELNLPEGMADEVVRTRRRLCLKIRSMPIAEVEAALDFRMAGTARRFASCRLRLGNHAGNYADWSEALHWSHVSCSLRRSNSQGFAALRYYETAVLKDLSRALVDPFAYLSSHEYGRRRFLRASVEELPQCRESRSISELTKEERERLQAQYLSARLSAEVASWGAFSLINPRISPELRLLYKSDPDLALQFLRGSGAALRDSPGKWPGHRSEIAQKKAEAKARAIETDVERLAVEQAEEIRRGFAEGRFEFREPEVLALEVKAQELGVQPQSIKKRLRRTLRKNQN